VTNANTDLRDLRELLSKALAAPWTDNDRGVIHANEMVYADLFGGGDEKVARRVAVCADNSPGAPYPRDWESAKLICALRNAAPKLLAVVDAAREELEACAVPSEDMPDLWRALHALDAEIT
jgi:hypothetical protein